MPVSSVATRARNHYFRQQRVALAGVSAVRAAVKAAGSAERAKSAAVTTVATYQALSAASAGNALATEAGRGLVSVPTAFAGETQLGFPIEYGIGTIVDRATQEVGADFERLLAEMMAGLDLFVASEIIAAGADAASVEIAYEPTWTNYVRVLNLPSCARCAILAGRIYRDLDGFARHPKCDCQHWPVESWAEAEAAGLVTDPMVAFERDQIRGLSRADARAIRDGADITAVVNAKRGGGRRPQGMTNTITLDMFGRTVKATLEGTTRRGEWRRKHPNLPIRLRPESIYEHAKDRADVLRLLRLYGYITSTT
jgi:hypothetical protein